MITFKEPSFRTSSSHQKLFGSQKGKQPFCNTRIYEKIQSVYLTGHLLFPLRNESTKLVMDGRSSVEMPWKHLNLQIMTPAVGITWFALQIKLRFVLLCISLSMVMNCWISCWIVLPILPHLFVDLDHLSLSCTPTRERSPGLFLVIPDNSSHVLTVNYRHECH